MDVESGAVTSDATAASDQNPNPEPSEPSGQSEVASESSQSVSGNQNQDPRNNPIPHWRVQEMMERDREVQRAKYQADLDQYKSRASEWERFTSGFEQLVNPKKEEPPRAITEAELSKVLEKRFTEFNQTIQQKAMESQLKSDVESVRRKYPKHVDEVFEQAALGYWRLGHGTYSDIADKLVEHQKKQFETYMKQRAEEQQKEEEAKANAVTPIRPGGGSGSSPQKPKGADGRKAAIRAILGRK